MFGLGPSEIIIILTVVVILFFGGEKISELAKGLGRFTGEFKKGKAEIEEEIRKAGKELRSDEQPKQTRKHR
jgi:sec-independent protein translocase protein TatA